MGKTLDHFRFGGKSFVELGEVRQKVLANRAGRFVLYLSDRTVYAGNKGMI